MSLDRRRSVGKGEFGSGAQEGCTHAVPAGVRCDGEAGDPPRVGIRIQQASQGPVSADARESITRSDPSPPDRPVSEVGDQAGRNVGVGHLAVEGGAIIVSLVRAVSLLGRWFEESPTPAPRRIIAPAAEYGHDVVPPLRCQRPDVQLGHGIEPNLLQPRHDRSTGLRTRSAREHWRREMTQQPCPAEAAKRRRLGRPDRGLCLLSGRRAQSPSRDCALALSRAC
jgi:hypothetical protein